MIAGAGTTYGSATAPFNATEGVVSVTDAAGHNHMPSPAAVKIVMDAYLNAPLPIVPHVDVGDPASYIAALGSTYAPYFVPAVHARGGDLVLEQPCGLGPAPCQFQAFPGTVGWLANFTSYSKQHFDAIRDDLFHWVFYTHARGKPKSAFPCLNAQAQPVPAASNGTCAVGPNPDFHVPSGASGVAQLPGNKAMISVGLWDTTNHVGSPELVASTTLHELGHNGELWHGGQGPDLESGDEAAGVRAELQAGVSQRDELPVPGPRTAGRQRRRALRLFAERSTTTSTKPTSPTGFCLPGLRCASGLRGTCLSCPGRWRTR